MSSPSSNGQAAILITKPDIPLTGKLLLCLSNNFQESATLIISKRFANFKKF